MTATEAPAGAPAALVNLPADDLAEIMDWLRENWKGGPAPERPTTVTEAICRVMAELPGIGKDQQAAPAQGGYRYRGIEAITAAAQHLFGKYGLIFGVPRVTDRKTIELTINGKPWTEEQLTIVYRVYGPSHGKVRARRVPTYNEAGLINGTVEIDEVVDDSIEIGPLIGLGRDNVDKGTNKALTQAYKYALIQTLCIGDSKDDPDGQGEAADARGQADGQPTDDERCQRLGWESKAAMDEAIESFRAMMKDRTEAGKMTREQAVDAWKAYLHPDPEQPDAVFWRSRADHDKFLAGVFGPEPAPAPAGEPPTAETPAPEPAAAETPAEPVQQAAEPQPAAEAKPAGYPDVPDDNGYRGRLDEVVRTEGVDGMIAALKQLDVEAVMSELQLRGAEVEGSMKVSEVRQLLGAILLARHTAGAGSAPASPAQATEAGNAPTAPAAADQPAQGTGSRPRRPTGRGATSRG